MNRRALLAILALAAFAPGPAQAAPPQQTDAPPAAKAPAPRAARPAAAAPSYKDLRYPPLRPIEIPKIEKYTLPNGMRLYLLEDHELPMVHGTALVRTGNLFDPPDKIGLAQMTGDVLRLGGTASKTGEEIDLALEDTAAKVESQIGETAGTLTFSALKENVPETMAIFHDVLAAPEFRQDKIDLAKSQYRSALARRNDDPQSLLAREFASTLYGRDNSYGWQESYVTIANIARPDIQAFYKRYFFPKNVMLAIWGDFDSAQMKAQVEKLFADWTVEQPEVPPFPKVTVKNSAGTYLAVKTDVTQTFFAIGQLSGELRDKDYPALETLANILGGGFHSRLMESIRAKMGKAYNISASWGAGYDHPGMFRISGSTQTPSSVDTLAAALQEVDRIRAAEVSEEELKTAKDTALNSLVFAFDTKSKSLMRVLTYEYYGYPPDFIGQYQKALAAVTRADILRVAKERLDPAKFAIVAVGNPNGFAKPLDTLGHKTTPIDLTMPDAAPALAAADPASLERGKQLLAAAQQAVGGAAKLAAVKDYVETATLDAVNPNIHAQQTMKWIAPNYWREEDEYPGSRVAIYTDGKNGWISAGQNSQLLGGPQAKQVNGNLFRSYIGLLLSAQTEGRTVNAIDAGAVEISDGNGNVARLIFDPATHFPKTLSYDAVSVAGAPPLVQESYSDFREVSGLQVPFKIVLTQNGKPYAQISVLDFKIDTGLRLEDMKKRP
jgi:zinc protease